MKYQFINLAPLYNYPYNYYISWHFKIQKHFANFIYYVRELVLIQQVKYWHSIYRTRVFSALKLQWLVASTISQLKEKLSTILILFNHFSHFSSKKVQYILVKYKECWFCLSFVIVSEEGRGRNLKIWLWALWWAFLKFVWCFID